MISRAAVDQRVREWGLRHEVVEKDYVLGWLLWGIGRNPVTYRFSEDLDFTVVGGGPIEPADVEPLLAGVLQRVADESGIDFSDRAPALRARPNAGSVEGRVYYRGPLAAPSVASVKLDLSANELLARPPERRPIAHPYEPDEALPEPTEVACYVFEEVFAEKLRAMGERSRPRDLYDIVNLYRRDDPAVHPHLRCRVQFVRAARRAAADAHRVEDAGPRNKAVNRFRPDLRDPVPGLRQALRPQDERHASQSPQEHVRLAVLRAIRLPRGHAVVATAAKATTQPAPFRFLSTNSRSVAGATSRRSTYPS